MKRVLSEVWIETLLYIYRHIAFSCFSKNKSANLIFETLTLQLLSPQCCPQFKSISLWFLPFFMVQFSHPYMTTGKTIGLVRWTFVDKVISLLFNMLSRLVIAFLPRNKCLLFSWLQSPSAVILEPKKIKSVTVSIVSPSVCHKVMQLGAMIFVFWVLSFKPAFSLSCHLSFAGR